MTATINGTLGGTRYQATLDEYTFQPDEVWLIPASGGFSVRVGVNNKDAVGFVAPIPDSDGLWRATRLDMFDDAYPSASRAALALVTRQVRFDGETGEIDGGEA